MNKAKELLIREKALALYGYDVSKGKLFNRITGKIVSGNTRNNGYLVLTIRFKGHQYTFLYHRVVWLIVKGKWPKEVIDHINGNRKDNRIENLRDISLTRNVQLRHRKNLRSGYIGISISKLPSGKDSYAYYYYSYFNGKRYYFGKSLYKAILFRCIHKLNV